MIRVNPMTTEVLLDNNITPSAESDAVGVITRALKSIQVYNPEGATVKIWKTLYNPSPEESIRWVQHGEDITEVDAFVSIDQAVRFLKVTRSNDAHPVTAILCVTVSTED